MKLPARFKGGPGSGFHGHSGRPGKVGGSMAGTAKPSNDDEQQLYDQVKQIAGLMGHPNSMYALVLKHGKFFKPTKGLPKGVRKGQMKECFMNAYKSMSEQYTYTEGYAWVEGLPLAFEHAWLTDSNGNAIDPTWTDGRGKAYFGVRFTEDYVMETAGKLGVYGVFSGNGTLIRDGIPTGAIKP